jgi:Flp pilus assembly protein TadG
MTSLITTFRANERGGALGIFGLCMPLLVGLVGAVTDYSTWTNQHQKLQKAADAAAIAAASELSMSAGGDARVFSVAESVVRSQELVNVGDGEIGVSATVAGDRGSVTVQLNQRKAAVLGILVTPGLTDVAVSATATLSGKRKVCVVALEPSKSHALELDGDSRLTALDCAVISNSTRASGLKVKGTAVLTAPFICSAGGYEVQGRIEGQRIADCPPQPDPLEHRPPPPVGPCRESRKLVIETDTTLFPGTYCGGIEIKQQARVTVNDGIVVIKDGQLKVSDSASLTGRNVGFYFTGSGANFDFLSSSTVDLGAPRSGPLAGILFYGDRSAPDTREYKITSDNARTLLGTLYIPQGFFTIDSKKPVADRSAYTAIIARKIELKHSPILTLNADYYATDVPVPAGLAPSNQVRLTR